MNEQRVHEELRALADDVGDIKRAVVGDARFGTLGLVKRVDRLERNQMKLFLKLATIGGGMGAVVALVVEILKHAGH